MALEESHRRKSLGREQREKEMWNEHHGKEVMRKGVLFPSSSWGGPLLSHMSEYSVGQSWLLEVVQGLRQPDRGAVLAV